MAKLRDFPEPLEVSVMRDVGEAIGGMGEVGLSAASGAIANAWARATGQQPRKFPLNAAPAYVPVPPGQLPVPAHRT